MRICIDARSLRDVPTSLGRYAADLVSHIAKLDRQNEYIVVRRPSRHGPLADQANFREIFAPYDISSAHNILAGARVINALDSDVYHSLYHFLPIGVRARCVVITLHDLIWVYHSHLADGRRWRRWVKGSLGSLGIRRAIAAADHIIAVSASTRQAAICHGHPRRQSNSRPPRGGSRLALGQCGTRPCLTWATRPTKTMRSRIFSTVLQNGLLPLAWATACRTKTCLGWCALLLKSPRPIPTLALVLAGRGEGNPALVRLAQQLGLSDRVLLVGQLSDDQIRACFAHALFFAFPSLIEGFGLPVLEAMASGCPVLTSNCFFARRSRRRKRSARRSARHRGHRRWNAAPADRFRAPSTTVLPRPTTGCCLHLGRHSPTNYSII